MDCNSLINIEFECTDVSKMHNDRAILFFIETSKNGKGITAVGVSLGYIPV